MIKVNEIYCGECSELMSQMPDGCVDLTVTSPPYDNLREYECYVFDFKSIAKQLYRVTKEGGVVVWVVNDQTINGSESLTSFKQAIYFVEECGFRLHDTMIYGKNSFMPLTHRRYEQCFEYMFILGKGRPLTFNPILLSSQTAGTKRNRGSSKAKETGYAERLRDEQTIVQSRKQASNIFFYDVGKNIKSAHNAPFPSKLAYDHIYSWSNPGDLVFDPMVGSGTTCVQAKKLGRKWLGFDISEKYCEYAKYNVESQTVDLF